MKTLLAIIGFLFCLAAFIGSTIPGMDFHVVFAPHKKAYEFHKERVIRYENKKALY